MEEVVHINDLEELKIVEDFIGYTFTSINYYTNDIDKGLRCINVTTKNTWGTLSRYVRLKDEYKIITFKEFILKEKLTNKINKTNNMQETMLEVLNKTYDNSILRKTTVPLFLSNPGSGKTSIIKEFAKNKGVRLLKITLSQRMPNEVVGMVMPDVKSGKMIVYDSHELESLKPGDILFFDEVFNGTLKQTLDAVLNLLEDRVLPSGKLLADVMIVAASNPQGLINLTPQIKERFIRYDLEFNKEEYQTYLHNKYAIPDGISAHFCTLINKEKFDSVTWNFVTPRSIEKAINQIGCGLISPYDTFLLPFLNEKVTSPCDINAEIKEGDEVEFLKILKYIISKTQTIKNDTKDQKLESSVASYLPS